MKEGLRVRLVARNADRGATLADIVQQAGHVLAPAESEDADVVLLDLDPDETPRTDRTLPTLVLMDRPRADREIEAVLPRAATAVQIEAALRAAVAGLIVRGREDGFAPMEAAAAPLLTPREIEILRAIGDGLSNKEVARRF